MEVIHKHRTNMTTNKWVSQNLKAFLFLIIICLPLGNISRFNIFHSTDNFPGPVKMRLADIDNDNKAKSYPCTNPFGNIMIVAPIISIRKGIAVIL
jgi:hypothetical protein